MPTLPVWPSDYDVVDAYAEFDPAILASLRTPADETALVAAVEVQLAARETGAPVLDITAQRHRARSLRAEQRAA